MRRKRSQGCPFTASGSGPSSQPRIPAQGAPGEGTRAASQVSLGQGSARGSCSSGSGLATPAGGARRGLRLSAATSRLQSATAGPPSEPLPAGRGSLPCRRPGSRRSAKSPWRRAIGEAERVRAALRPTRTARSALQHWTWDVALAAAREPGRTARREIFAVAARPQSRLKQRHLLQATGTDQSARGAGRKGGAERGVLARKRKYRSSI